MIPVYQTDTGVETGNCGEACVASILELPLRAIPSFKNPKDRLDGKYYRDATNAFLRQYGLTIIEVSVEDELELTKDFKDCWAIATVTAHGAKDPEKEKHAVVWYNGEIVHDPLPFHSGEPYEKIETLAFFIKCQPWTQITLTERAFMKSKDIAEKSSS